jgi:hypothetical protein
VLLKQKPDDYDAYLAVGVENYLSGIKPGPHTLDPLRRRSRNRQGAGGSRPRADRRAWRPASSVRPTNTCRISAPRQEPIPSLQPAHRFVAALHAQPPLPT